MMGNLGGSYADSKLAQAKHVKSIEDLRTKKSCDFGEGCCAESKVLYTLALARRLPPNVLALPTTWLQQMQDSNDLLDLVRRDWAVQTNSSWCSQYLAAKTSNPYAVKDICLFASLGIGFGTRSKSRKQNICRPRQVVTHSLHPAIVEQSPQVFLGITQGPHLMLWSHSAFFHNVSQWFSTLRTGLLSRDAFGVFEKCLWILSHSCLIR